MGGRKECRGYLFVLSQEYDTVGIGQFSMGSDLLPADASGPLLPFLVAPRGSSVVVAAGGAMETHWMSTH